MTNSKRYLGEEAIGKGAISRPGFEDTEAFPERKGYIKFGNGSVNLTGLDGRQAFNLRFGPEGKLIVSYHGNETEIDIDDMATESTVIKYKYKEDVIINDLKAYIDSTYDAHYNTNDNIQVLDAWLALGNFVTTCRDVAIKYLWRYGKKDGSLKKDLFKAMHYTLLMMYGDHYRDD